MTIEERNKRIKEAYENGSPVERIANMARISSTHVHNILNKMGVAKTRKASPAHISVTWNEEA